MFTFAKHLPGLLKNQLTRAGEATAFRQLHRPFKELRKKFHLRKRHQYMDELEGDFTLVCDLPSLFPQKELPSTYLQLPPLFFEPNSYNSANRLSIDPRKKTIYVSMGSTGEWNKVKFLNHAYFEKFNIVASGCSYTSIGNHVQHIDFINPHELLRQTDLVICHGGNGTIYQALQYEIPLLCKTSHCEQEWNVEALERNQLGQSLDDVEGMGSYIDIVEKWIDRKGGPIFNNCSRRITKSIADLPHTLNTLAGKILERNASAAHAVLETYS